MSHFYRPEHIHNALAAVEAKAKGGSVRENDNDDKTVRPRPTSSQSFAAATFEGFEDHKLDLTLSVPSSPVASTSSLPPDDPSPPPSSPPSPPPVQHSLSRTRSFATQAISPLIKSSKKLSTPQLSSMTMPSGSRGSWPGVKYTGRGTPIDRKRNRQWGGFISEEEDGVGEDGILFSNARPASLDSHIRPPKRSLSPEWNYLPALTSPSISSQPEEETEPAPALAPINLGTDQSDDWDSIMQTVLGSTDSPPSESPSTPPEEPQSAPTAVSTDSTSVVAPPVDFHMMTPDQIEELHNGLETHLGIHQALDLGLGINITQGGGKMNLFKLGLLPSSASGRETPSIYSQAETPRGSPPATIIQHDDDRGRSCDETPLSSTSTKAEPNTRKGPKSGEQTWWRRVVKGMRKLQESVSYHKTRLR
ncbi:hypothetical protein CC2G_006853 [Coprinopsis cinerea AmutBmut pab1-1]|nr:hypothetical protein CC2G_006853 [Coprinopsis cinerea AmutBmut pab1-1]